jgi:hypothetical protein
MRKLLLCCLMSILAFVACRKGELPEEHYFGKVSVTALSFPDAPVVDIYLDDEKIGDIDPAQFPTRDFSLLAGKAGRLKVVTASNQTVIIDTAITVQPNSRQEFRIGYSESLGIKGLIGNTVVPADSMRFQFLFNFRQDFNPYPVADLYICEGFVENGIVVKGLQKGQLNPTVLTLPVYNSQHQPINYFCKLKDVATGEFIQMKGVGTDLIGLTDGTDSNAGHYSIVDINDALGDEYFNLFLANLITL